ncbi:MAG: hypothetical protein K2K46_09645, partial [Lachnospiraceae bacterium]|nr:hypothetical protein [Lachnospiraceae bacterium]
KNMINVLYNIFEVLSVYLGQINLVYENTYTNISGENINAAFFFDVLTDYESVLLKSEKSQKVTAIALNDIMITSTLYVKNYDEVMRILKELKLIQNMQSIPSWMENIKMFDDSKQLSIIEENNNAIKIANDNIFKAKEKISKNNEYKSILYTNGDELVRVVFEILETMLGCDLSEFDDKKKEDFLFEIDGFVFIGEIKGVNHNVKSENVSQLEVHYQGYVEDNNKDENQIKAILIMNHQKNKPLDTREPVHEKQISLADRNGSLIVETITLLKLFERYLSDDLSREECIELLKSKKGLLTI